ncbi:hypothetical protein GDO78_009444, partial [Eleutherodactylus coqui]
SESVGGGEAVWSRCLCGLKGGWGRSGAVPSNKTEERGKSPDTAAGPYSGCTKSGSRRVQVFPGVSVRLSADALRKRRGFS